MMLLLHIITFIIILEYYMELLWYHTLFVLSCHLQADKETDEIYAQMSLQPVNSVSFLIYYLY